MASNLFIMMMGRKLRVRSQVAELGYISPWKLQQETSRDLENFLNKNHHHEQNSPSPVFRWGKGESLNGRHPRTEPTYTKKTARTAYPHAATEFKQTMERTFNRNFYSKSVSLRRQSLPEKQCPTQPIFIKRFRESQRPRLVTLGNGQAETRPRWSRQTETRAGRRKKEHFLRKQSLTQGVFRQEITSQKDFLTSLENCLVELQRGAGHNSKLASTMKGFLSQYKKL